MKPLVFTVLAATVLISNSLLADPVSLTDSQMDQITAGFGANNDSTPGSKFNGIMEGLHHLDAADGGIQNNPSGDNPAIGPLGGVGVPSAVPTPFPSCGYPFACAFD